MLNINEDPSPQILWYMHYDQQSNPPTTEDDYDANLTCDQTSNDHVLQLPDLAPGLALEDDVLKHVRAAYERIMGKEGAGFMMFEDREGAAEEDNDGEDV